MNRLTSTNAFTDRSRYWLPLHIHVVRIIRDPIIRNPFYFNANLYVGTTVPPRFAYPQVEATRKIIIRYHLPLDFANPMIIEWAEKKPRLNEIFHADELRVLREDEVIISGNIFLSGFFACVYDSVVLDS